MARRACKARARSDGRYGARGRTLFMRASIRPGASDAAATAAATGRTSSAFFKCYFRYLASQPRTSPYQWREFWPLRIQWFSSG